MTQMPQTDVPRRNRIVVLLPLILFLALAALFLIRLGSGDPSRIPSALIGRPAPMTNLPAVPGLERNGKPLPGLDPAAFRGNVSLVNVWASWCVPCHDEVPFLQQLAQDPRIRLIGINYKDQPDNARRFLNRYAIRSRRPAPMTTAAPRSNGASTACRRRFWSAATAASPISSSARSMPRISSACSCPNCRRRWAARSAFGGVPTCCGFKS